MGLEALPHCCRFPSAPLCGHHIVGRVTLLLTERFENPPVIIPGENGCLSPDLSSLSAPKTEVKFSAGLSDHHRYLTTVQFCYICYVQYMSFCCFFAFSAKWTTINQYIASEKYYRKYWCSNVYSVYHCAVTLLKKGLCNKQDCFKWIGYFRWIVGDKTFKHAKVSLQDWPVRKSDWNSNSVSGENTNARHAE